MLFFSNDWTPWKWGVRHESFTFTGRIMTIKNYRIIIDGYIADKCIKYGWILFVFFLIVSVNSFVAGKPYYIVFFRENSINMRFDLQKWRGFPSKCAVRLKSLNTKVRCRYYPNVIVEIFRKTKYFITPCFPCKSSAQWSVRKKFSSLLIKTVQPWISSKNSFIFNNNLEIHVLWTWSEIVLRVKHY